MARAQAEKSFPAFITQLDAPIAIGFLRCAIRQQWYGHREIAKKYRVI